jgi:hypothetical protein
MDSEPNPVLRSYFLDEIFSPEGSEFQVWRYGLQISKAGVDTVFDFLEAGAEIVFGVCPPPSERVRDQLNDKIKKIVEANL